MGKWSNLGDGSAVNDVKINQTFETKNGFTHDLDYIVEENGLGGCNIRLRSLFDEVLRAFLSERSENKCFRPVPALLGDGRPVDLFRLFWAVRRIGGYDLVCRENLWGFVMGQCGLGFGAIALVKLVYVKYLNEFDQWLWCLYRESRLENGESGIGRKLDLFSREMEAKFRGSLFSGGEENKIETEFVELEYDRCRKFIELDNGENDVHLSAVGNVDELHEDTEYSTNDDVEKLFLENDNDLVFSAKRVVEKVINEVHDDTKQQINDNNGKCCAQEDDDVVESVKKVLENIVSKVHEYSENYIDDFEEGMCADNDDSISVPVTNVVEKVLDFRKRKRESSSLSGMLSWIKHVAKHSDDLAIGQLPKSSECKTHGTDKPWIQVLLAREARSIRRHTSLNAEESPLQQKRLRMQPSQYGDDELNKKLRGSEI